MDMASLGDLDATKLTQMLDTVKKTIDSATSPENLTAAIDKIKSLSDSIMKMGLNLAKGGAGRR